MITGCEAASELGGMFTVLIPDNLGPVVDKADRLEPVEPGSRSEYSQARGLAS